MFTTTRLEGERRAALLTRLKSIEGQARGLQRMLEDERECQQIMDQFAALRAASHAVTMQAIECFALHSAQESTDSPEQIVADLVGAFSKMMR
jgi:CsoR family transcriptional regulator, copper-sensing transcriptional repressor